MSCNETREKRNVGHHHLTPKVQVILKIIVYLDQLDIDKMYSSHPNHPASLDFYSWDTLHKGQAA
jgi:hypothetical protein